MINFLFIRHGQSQSNAGERITDPAKIELTELGKKQAEFVAGKFYKGKQGKKIHILVYIDFNHAWICNKHSFF